MRTRPTSRRTRPRRPRTWTCSKIMQVMRRAKTRPRLKQTAKPTGIFLRPSVGMLTIAVCATCGPHVPCVDGVKSQSCHCDPEFQETDIDGEKVCENIDDCGGAASIGSRDHDSRKCGGQTTSQEFLFGVSRKTSDFAFDVQNRAGRSSEFGRGARCQERGISHED